jgi:hypothetical protein
VKGIANNKSAGYGVVPSCFNGNDMLASQLFLISNCRVEARNNQDEDCYHEKVHRNEWAMKIAFTVCMYESLCHSILALVLVLIISIIDLTFCSSLGTDLVNLVHSTSLSLTVNKGTSETSTTLGQQSKKRILIE